MSETKLAAAQGLAEWTEITGRRWKIKAGDQMTRDHHYDADWSPVDDSLVGSLASDQVCFHGWRIRRPNTKADRRAGRLR